MQLKLSTTPRSSILPSCRVPSATPAKAKAKKQQEQPPGHDPSQTNLVVGAKRDAQGKLVVLEITLLQVSKQQAFSAKHGATAASTESQTCSAGAQPQHAAQECEHVNILTLYWARRMILHNTLCPHVERPGIHCKDITTCRCSPCSEAFPVRVYGRVNV